MGVGVHTVSGFSSADLAFSWVFPEYVAQGVFFGRALIDCRDLGRNLTQFNTNHEGLLK